MSQEPQLILLYSSNPNFNNKPSQFIYEADSKLGIVPFDFTKNAKEQIEFIIGYSYASKPLQMHLHFTQAKT